MENELLKAALEYSEKFGYPIIPVNPINKRPMIKWEEFQQRKATVQEINSWWEKWPSAMIGGVTGNISHDFVIDVDTSEGQERIDQYLPDTLVTPTSITPRGGKHLHFEYPNEDLTVKAGFLPHVDYRGQGGYITLPPSRNSEGKKYRWVEGLSLIDVTKATLPNALLLFIKSLALGLKSNPHANSEKTTEDHKFFDFGRRDEDLFSVANAMSKQGLRTDFIANTLERLILSWGENPDPRWIDAKIKSAFDRLEKKERNIFEEVKQWVMTTRGHFLTTESHRELQMTTKNEKKAAIMALLRLKNEGIIETYGEKKGCYRLIESSSDEIDFLGVEEKVVDIKWPFQIEEWVKILPKNIIVIAGEVNAGKTAFLLSTCYLNMGSHKINYFSSEMGALELRDRLKKFEGNLQHWKTHINFRERASNFADVIKPNEVNIIDFLEITDEFYKVGGMIKEIFDKLKKGVAIIALQKNPKTDWGLGGLRSVEKARLYLAIEQNRIKIVKGKNWAVEVNPNGISRSFKLIQGARFIATSEWEKGK